MIDPKLVEIITARVLSELNAPTVNASSDASAAAEHDRQAFRSFSDEVRACRSTAGQRLIPVGVSARHAHVTQEHLEILYGRGHNLTVHAPLYQPGEFAARETLAVVGPRMRAMERVRILGPVRKYTQVEFAPTDSVFLGLNPPIRDSGHLDDAQYVTLVGPKGSLYVKAAICPTRHIHLNPTETAYYGVKAGEFVSVRIKGERALTLENVLIRVHPNVIAQMHLDTDDANAAGLRGGEGVEMVIC
ncbi:MAG: phosphate propanoyltransferase [Candidatus Poribacteria bacterium]|nr:phosphate propanoyltransferase [Candidatus Poribacteria bacterium]